MPRELLAEVARVMSQADWKFAIDPNLKKIYAIWSADDCHLLAVMDILEQHEIVKVKVRMERNCPANQRGRLALWCNQKNWNLRCGFFMCDQTDGEVLFRDSVDCEDISLTSTFIDNLLKRVLRTVSQSYLEIQQIMSLNDH
jgi:hypothetical protein